MKVRGIEVEERFIDEEILPKDRKAWITAMQVTFIWTGTEFAFIGCRFGDVSTSSISNDIRKMIQEKIPILKRKYEPEVHMRKEKKHEKETEE